MKYDYLIVGAGLYGATFARVLTDAGKKCLIIDRRDHVGGNCYDEKVHGIYVNRYGGHIFHTNSEKVWKFVNRFAYWTPYEHRVKAYYRGMMYSFPPNRMTMQQLGVWYDEAGYQRIEDIFFRGFSEKHWGMPLEEIPTSILKRIDIRQNWDDRYFTDKYQAMPHMGYTGFIRRMIGGIEFRLQSDFINRNVGSSKYYYTSKDATKIIYSGSLDELFDYEYGELDYRSQHWEHHIEDGDFQGCATVHYPDPEVDYTRILEWKHYGWHKNDKTIYSIEFPQAYDGNNERNYPIPDVHNLSLYQRYHRRALELDWLLVGGRLGSYKYMNMDEVILQAMNDAERELRQ